jgi:tRNA pseudouridine38-40 synthase
MLRVRTGSRSRTPRALGEVRGTPTTTRWLVRFGYDGAPFAGWARQPGACTVEGAIRRGLARFGRARGPVADGLEVASRTDRGVSARANALTVRSPLAGDSLLRMLNGITPEIFFSAATPVPEGFRVRAASRRVYRYFDGAPVRSDARRQEAAALFVGPVDVRSLGRGLAGEEPLLRPIEAVTIASIPGGSLVEVRAPSFVWGMVRKIVGALREVDAGRLPLSRLRAALAGRSRLPLPLAEPEPLVLWEVEVPVRWTHRWPGPNRHQAHAAASGRVARWARDRVAEAIADA